jgi:hypothetical protein
VAAAAQARGITVEGEPGKEPLPVEVVTSVGQVRARSMIVLDHASGLAVEAKHRLLAGSIDAARG